MTLTYPGLPLLLRMIAWPGGYDAASALAGGGAGKAPRAVPKVRGPASSAGTKSKQVEKYSSSYTSIALVPDTYL